MFRTLVSTGLALAMFAAFSAFGAETQKKECPTKAGDKKEMSEDRAGGGGERLAEALDLTAQQQEQMKALRAKQREEMKPLRGGVHEALAALRKLVDEGGSDAAIKAQLDALKAARTQMQAAQQKHQDEVAGILSPKQQAKLVLMFAHGMRDRAAGGAPEGPRRPRR